MKTHKIIYGLIFALALGVIASCTGRFDDINRDPRAIGGDEVSARYFITGAQTGIWVPNRFPYWRGPLIHGDRYGGVFCFGFNSSWWSDELSYSYNPGYTDAAFGGFSGAFGSLDNFMKLVDVGGEFENELMYAVALIHKSLYFQVFTDTFGELPYSQVGDTDILEPAYDSQMDIYKGLIADLERAIDIIGDNTATGIGADDLGTNDLVYGGDLQKWKRLANSHILRIAMRAYGAPGEDFAQAAVDRAMARGFFMESEGDIAQIVKDIDITQWASAGYGDIWHNFGAGSDWTVGKPVIDYLRDYSDPRLTAFAQPAVGGEIVMNYPDGSDVAVERMRIQFLLDNLDDANVDYTAVESATATTVNINGSFFIGQPLRLNDRIKPYAAQQMFSAPAKNVVGKNTADGETPELIMTVAESYLLRAEAALLGLTGENAQAMFTMGIQMSMAQWGVSGDAYVANAEIAQLNGTMEENIERIAIQRWLANYTLKFESWAVARDFGFPTEVNAKVSDPEIHGLGTTDGEYPERLRYGSQAYSTNLVNLEAAIARQGADEQKTQLWFAKGSKF